MSHRALFTLTLFLSVANILVWSFLGIERAYANRVYPGVWVQAQPLAGLTREQAIDRLKPINDAMVSQKVILKLNDKEYRPTLLQLGYSVDTGAMASAALELGRGKHLPQLLSRLIDYQKDRNVQLVYDIDQGQFDSYLNDIGKEITKDPKNMGLDYRGDSLVVTPAEAGNTLDKEEIRRAIQQRVKPGEAATINLTVGTSEPVLNNESQLQEAKDQLTKLLTKPLILQAGENSVSWNATKIYSFVYYEIMNNKLVVTINQDKVRAAVAEIAKSVDKPAVTKQVSAIDNSTLQEGVSGKQLDAPDAIKRAMERLSTGDMEAAIVLKVDTIDPKIITISPEYMTGRFPGRYVEIDLSSQRMHLMEGTQYHKTFIVSTGKWDRPTPIGTFKILNHISVAWSKRYKLYMPNWMGLQTAEGGLYDGYGIHGLPYWPDGRKEGENHLGRPVSHGCIRLGAGDIDYLYGWAENGTPVVIHQ